MDLEDTLKTALSKSMGEKETEGFNVYPVFRRGLKDCPYLRTSGQLAILQSNTDT